MCKSNNDGGSQLWRNDGGIFTRVNNALPTDGSTYSYDAGDVDGDGDLDLLGANSGWSNRELLILNGGDGTSWTDVSSNIITNPTADDNDSKFIDFDMDGDLDFVIAALGANTDRFYRNNGNGSYIQTNNIQTAINDSSLDIGFADLDGDGKAALIAYHPMMVNETSLMMKIALRDLAFCDLRKSLLFQIV